MKKQLLGMGLAATLALTASPSFATGKHHTTIFHDTSFLCKLVPILCEKPETPVKPGKPDKPHAVPEIDAANAGLALALIGGLVAIRRERRNRRNRRNRDD